MERRQQLLELFWNSSSEERAKRHPLGRLGPGDRLLAFLRLGVLGAVKSLRHVGHGYFLPRTAGLAAHLPVSVARAIETALAEVETGMAFHQIEVQVRFVDEDDILVFVAIAVCRRVRGRSFLDDNRRGRRHR